jgi:hypothetical protein
MVPKTGLKLSLEKKSAIVQWASLILKLIELRNFYGHFETLMTCHFKNIKYHRDGEPPISHFI